MDSYEIGSESSSQGYFDYAEEWFDECLSKFVLLVPFNSTFNTENILRKIIDNKFAQMDERLTEKYAKKLLQREEESSVSTINRRFFPEFSFYRGSHRSTKKLN